MEYLDMKVNKLKHEEGQINGLDMRIHRSDETKRNNNSSTHMNQQFQCFKSLVGIKNLLHDRSSVARRMPLITSLVW